MKDFLSSIYKAFIIASVVSFIIGFSTTGNSSLGALMSGYSILIMGVLMVMLTIFNKMSQTVGNTMAIISMIGPFLLILGILGFWLYLTITYKDMITENHVSKNYSTFANISIMLILIQIAIMYGNITGDEFEKTGKVSKVTLSLMYLLGVLTFISTVISYSILKYFTTDGFRV